MEVEAFTDQELTCIRAAVVVDIAVVSRLHRAQHSPPVRAALRERAAALGRALMRIDRCRGKGASGPVPHVTAALNSSASPSPAKPHTNGIDSEWSPGAKSPPSTGG